MADEGPREIASGRGWVRPVRGGRGGRPAEEFLRLLSERKERVALAELAGVLRLFALMSREGRIVGEERFRYEDDGIWVFKKGSIRIFAFQEGDTWYLTNGYRKQGRKMPQRAFKRAKRIRAEHQERGTKGR